jgi:hypothetical protein
VICVDSADPAWAGKERGAEGRVDDVEHFDLFVHLDLWGFDVVLGSTHIRPVDNYLSTRYAGAKIQNHKVAVRSEVDSGYAHSFMFMFMFMFRFIFINYPLSVATHPSRNVPNN